MKCQEDLKHKTQQNLVPFQLLMNICTFSFYRLCYQFRKHLRFNHISDILIVKKHLRNLRNTELYCVSFLQACMNSCHIGIHHNFICSLASWETVVWSFPHLLDSLWYTINLSHYCMIRDNHLVRINDKYVSYLLCPWKSLDAISIWANLN